MIALIGLGNPGETYKKNRHNTGFIILDYIANEFKSNFTENKKLLSSISEINVDNQKILLVKPNTYMNLSGDAVLNVINYFKLSIKDLIIIYDDKDIPLGTIRIRKEGTHGGHNGMKDIINKLKTTEIQRIRIGIGKENIKDTIKYVLGNFTNDEIKIIKKCFDKIWDKVKTNNLIDETITLT